jgi:hypothetical protein
MRIEIGTAERETRRGSYWTVPVIVHNENSDTWHADVIAVAHGATQQQAISRARFIRKALTEQSPELRAYLGAA